MLDKSLSHYIKPTKKYMDQQYNYLIQEINQVKGDLVQQQHKTQGVVYRGYIAQQWVAIKIINLSMYDNAAYQQQLKNEVQLLLSLQSPNVVRIYEVMIDKDAMELYMVMEFCQQGDLMQLLNKQPQNRVSEQVAIEVISQILSGLKELIKQDYIHRDIKPENILINEKQFKLADFGLAAKIPSTKVLRAQAGTPLYMAPQILQNQQYTSKCDIWSLGLVMYQMIYGKTPWLCRNMDTYIAQIMTIPLKFPYQIQVSQSTKEFIRNCLQINEKDRYDWNDLITHPIFKPQQSKLKRQSTLERLNFTVKEHSILQMLQETIQAHGLHPKDLLKYCNKQMINKNDFYNMLQKVVHQLNQQDSDCLFAKFDTSQDGLISSDEFSYVFSEYDFTPIMNLSEQIIHELKEIVRIYQIKLDQLFKQFDRDSSGGLDLNEFTVLIRRIAPRLGIGEIKGLFNSYDQDKNGLISLKEFKFALRCQNFQRLSRVLQNLRETIRIKKVDIRVLFHYVDTSGKGVLNFEDFGRLISRIDNLSESDLIQLFKLFDGDGNGYIEMQEFIKQIY